MTAGSQDRPRLAAWRELCMGAGPCRPTPHASVRHSPIGLAACVPTSCSDTVAAPAADTRASTRTRCCQWLPQPPAGPAGPQRGAAGPNKDCMAAKGAPGPWWWPAAKVRRLVLSPPCSALIACDRGSQVHAARRRWVNGPRWKVASPPPLRSAAHPCAHRLRTPPPPHPLAGRHGHGHPHNPNSNGKVPSGGSSGSGGGASSNGSVPPEELWDSALPEYMQNQGAHSDMCESWEDMLRQGEAGGGTRSSSTIWQTIRCAAGSSGVGGCGSGGGGGPVSFKPSPGDQLLALNGGAFVSVAFRCCCCRFHNSLLIPPPNHWLQQGGGGGRSRRAAALLLPLRLHPVARQL